MEIFMTTCICILMGTVALFCLGCVGYAIYSVYKHFFD